MVVAVQKEILINTNTWIKIKKRLWNQLSVLTLRAQRSREYIWCNEAYALISYIYIYIYIYICTYLHIITNKP